jgi:hypothetical protein
MKKNLHPPTSTRIICARKRDRTRATVKEALHVEICSAASVLHRWPKLVDTGPDRALPRK